MSKQVCLTPGCNRTDIESRGLCTPCYHAAYRLQRIGKTTWAKLVRAKLALPKAKIRHTANKMRKAILGMK